jgi:hypothetical protein
VLNEVKKAFPEAKWHEVYKVWYLGKEVTDDDINRFVRTVRQIGPDVRKQRATYAQMVLRKHQGGRDEIAKLLYDVFTEGIKVGGDFARANVKSPGYVRRFADNWEAMKDDDEMEPVDKNHFRALAAKVREMS